MPCTYTGSLDGDRAYIAEEKAEVAQKKVIKLTQLLCEAMTQIDRFERFAQDDPPVDFSMDISKKLRRWWAHHQEIDKIGHQLAAGKSVLSKEELVRLAKRIIEISAMDAEYDQKLKKQEPTPKRKKKVRK